ncbi:MAG: ferredoxin--NADP reductase [Planctomycetes bacterium]|nr:ferredoxin--NADP reductase [Planctomycetota bacterium]
MNKSELNWSVAQKIEVAPGLMVLRVVPREGEVPDFEPGQFAVLGLPGSAPRCFESSEEDAPKDPEKLVRRAYSIASSSASKEYLEFYVTLVRSGQLTPRLFALSVGDPLYVGPKIAGQFTLADAPDDKHVIFVGTGTGLAPYMSMVRTRLVCGEARRFIVIHGARHSWDLGYRSELITLSRLCGNFMYFPTISRPQEEPMPWKGLTGYVSDVWTSRIVEQKSGIKFTPENSVIFLCGNPDMAEGMLALAAKEGFREHHRKNPGHVFVERYW